MVFVTVWLLLAASSLEAADRQVLRHRFASLATTLQAVDRLPATNRLRAALCLPLRNQPALTNLLSQIYNPASPNHRRFLTPEQFTEQFGPTKEDYAAVVAFAQAQGLTVTTTHPNRTLVDVEGTTAAFEHTFHTTLRVYQHPNEKRTFHAPDVAPSIDLAVPVLSVCGLDDFARPRPAGLHPKARAATRAMTTPEAQGYLMGYDFRKAYAPGVTLTGTGQSVGLLQFDGYYASDIASYESQAGLPSVPLQNIMVDGYNGAAGVNNSEVAMDIEMVASMAPGLSKIIVYECDPGGYAIDVLNRMATDNAAKQLSASWTWGQLDTGTEQVFQQFAAQGQSYFNASGDSDAYTANNSANPIYNNAPVDDPNITIVGGTTVTTNSIGAWASETTWNWGDNGDGTATGTGGGVSTTYSLPSWQQGISMTANHGSTLMRNIPDVSMAADNIWVIYDNGSSGAFGGTSASSPLWAGFTALINQQAVARGLPVMGFLNPALYALGASGGYAAAFHDITTGDNKWTSSPSDYPAVAGYDLCTGWGTPAGQGLIDALASAPDALTLTVQSAHGSPVPGTGSLERDSLVNASINSPVISGTTQYVCTGASVAGNDFTAISATNLTLYLTNNATLTWNWQMQYRLTTAVSGAGSVTTGGWFTPGDSVVLTATPSNTAHFTGWSGQTSGCSIVSSLFTNQITVPMTQVRTITAVFGAGALPVISGKVTQSGTSTPLAGVWIAFSGLSTLTTDGSGNYSLTVPYGWSGSVTPSTNGLTGGAFSLPTKAYSSLKANVNGLNFSWIPPPVIAGRVILNGTSVGVAGVLLNFSNNGGTTNTDSNGYYTMTVPYNWSGSVTPSTNGLTGGAFSLPTKAYSSLKANVNGLNFSWIPPPVIAGRVILNGTSVGVAGVLLNFSNNGGTTNTDSNGYYTMTVPYNWSGSVTPSTNGLTGGAFSLPTKAYSSLKANVNGLNFSWIPPPVIAGRVILNGTSVGVAGVLLNFSNNGGTTNTDSNGYYTMTVPYNWSGSVTPSTNGLTGGAFSPINKPYTSLKANASGVNFSWIPPPVISGRITRSGNSAPAVGLVVVFSGGAGTTTTDTNGSYSMTVPYNWTGTATPSTNGTGGTFLPVSKPYSALKANASAQNYVWTAPAASIKPAASATQASVVLLRTTGAVQWTGGDDVARVQQAAELLSIGVSEGASKVTLPVAIAAPGDLSAAVVIEPDLQTMAGTAGENAVVIRNHGGAVDAGTLLPNATVLGGVTLLPSGDRVVLTWDLSVSRP